LSADAAYLEVPVLDPAPRLYLVGQTNLLYLGAVEVQDPAATGTDKMMVAFRVPVEPQPITGDLNPGDQALVLEPIQDAVHGIEGDVREPFTNPLEYHIHGRMPGRPNHLTKDFRALGGNAQTAPPAPFPKRLHTVSEFFPVRGCCLHDADPNNPYIVLISKVRAGVKPFPCARQGADSMLFSSRQTWYDTAMP
jgi:hypothetical protein